FHADRGHEPGFAAHAFKCVLKCQSVDHRGRHAHVMGGRLLDDVRAAAELAAPQDVAASDHDGELNSGGRDPRSLAGDPADFLDTDAPLAGPAEAFAGKLEQNPSEHRSTVAGVTIHRFFLKVQEVFPLARIRIAETAAGQNRSAVLADDEASKASDGDV